jgi:hypothetical protein
VLAESDGEVGRRRAFSRPAASRLRVAFFLPRAKRARKPEEREKAVVEEARDRCDPVAVEREDD